MNYELDQTSRLAISGILSAGYPETCEPQEHENTIVSRAAFPLPRHCLAGGIPRAPRHYWRDDAEGEASPDIEGDEDEQAPRYGAHILPSMRDRASVSRELRAMGFTWGE